MAIIRDNIVPSLGLPQQAIAPSRRQLTMAQPGFYNQQLQQATQPTGGSTRQSLTSQNPQQQSPVDQTYFNTPQQQSFEQDPMSGDYIQQQLANYAQRSAPPELQPGDRVKSPNMELVQPSNFQAYYEQLATIDQAGQEMLGAAQGRSAYQRLQSLNAINSQQVQPFKGASLGNATGSIPSNPKANFTYAQQIAPNFGWGAADLAAWYTLGMKESGWNNNAQNPTSTAYGIGQFLDSTWKGVGGSKTADPATQVQYMAQYIKNRYGSPSAALAFHNAHNWY
jgi:hypothetical protein